MIGKYDVKNYFPEYKGPTGPESGREAAKFFKQLFLSNAGKKSKEVVSHLTCGVDSNGMKVIINTVVTDVITKTLKTIGLA
jgi:hypothetical protein